MGFTMSGCKDQFDRVLRYLNRIEDQNRGSIEYDDDLWSFFQNCWHLKDWIKNDQTAPPELRNNIEKIVKDYLNIIVCADLANRTKHLHLSLNPCRFDAKVIQRNATASISRNIPSTCEHIIALNDGRRVVALKVAREATLEWKIIFKKYGLTI